MNLKKRKANVNGQGVVRELEGSGKAAMIPKVEMLTDEGSGDVLQAGDGDNMFQEEGTACRKLSRKKGEQDQGTERDQWCGER